LVLAGSLDDPTAIQAAEDLRIEMARVPSADQLRSALKNVQAAAGLGGSIAGCSDSLSLDPEKAAKHQR
jgi:hypothetical protein